MIPSLVEETVWVWMTKRMELKARDCFWGFPFFVFEFMSLFD